MGVSRCRSIQNLSIDLSPLNGEPFRHLILTGPNASGKTSLLNALVWYINQQKTGRKKSHPEFELAIEWEGSPPARGNEESLYAFFEAFRKTEIQQVQGPNRLVLRASSLNLSPNTANQLAQYLVNKKTEQAFAKDEDEEKVATIDRWFHEFERNLARVFGYEDLRLAFDQKNFEFQVHLQNNGSHPFTFQQMADGHKAALAIFAELFLRCESLCEEHDDVSDPDGVVLIDEIETHLHLALQEAILPFLCEMFPRIQFIVATHSPAVISSVDNAVVFDLRDKRPVESDELQGIRYGTLMKSHFGIETDYDLETTEELRKLEELWKTPSRDEQQQLQLEELASQLSKKSHSLALEVSLRLKENPSVSENAP